jgi:hypothetical protein
MELLPEHNYLLISGVILKAPESPEGNFFESVEIYRSIISKVSQGF